MAIKQENRWAARPRLATVLRASIYSLPVVLAMVAAAWTRQWVHGVAPSIGEFGAVGLSLIVAIAVVAGGERMGRRMLPLAMLLKMSLLFPDAAPSRLKVALRAASTKRLRERTADSSRPDRGWAEETLTLVAALNAHDRRTRGHSERVRALSMLMADELGLSTQERDMLEWASLLHDIGKTTVPSEILNKPGRPDADEWKILSGHPAAGGELAEPLRAWLGEWVHAIDQHHEKWDGSGYPLGLRGTDIAPSGRIVAVTDAFETMTAIRSYKQGMTAQAARDELVACSGKHFDPAMVRAFMSISVGRLHWAMGPASWATSLPFGSLAPKLAGLGSAAMGGVAVPVVMGGSLAILAPTALASTGAMPWDSEPAISVVDGTRGGDASDDDLRTEDEVAGETQEREGATASDDDRDGERGRSEGAGERTTSPESDVDRAVPVDSAERRPGEPDGGSRSDTGAVGGLVDDLGETTGRLVDDVDGLVGDTLGSAVEAVGGAAAGLPGGDAVGYTADEVLDGADELVGDATGGVGGVADDIDEALNPITDGVDGLLGGGAGGGGGGGLLGLG